MQRGACFDEGDVPMRHTLMSRETLQMSKNAVERVLWWVFSVVEKMHPLNIIWVTLLCLLTPEGCEGGGSADLLEIVS